MNVNKKNQKHWKIFKEFVKKSEFFTTSLMNFIHFINKFIIKFFGKNFIIIHKEKYKHSI